MIEPKRIKLNIRKKVKDFLLEEVLSTCPHRGEGKDKKNYILILDN